VRTLPQISSTLRHGIMGNICQCKYASHEGGERIEDSVLVWNWRVATCHQRGDMSPAFTQAVILRHKRRTVLALDLHLASQPTVIYIHYRSLRHPIQRPASYITEACVIYYRSLRHTLQKPASYITEAFVIH